MPVRLDLRSGQFTRVGRLGDGPGEFRNVSNLMAGPGTDMLVYDQLQHRVTRMTSAGALVESRSMETGRSIGFGALRTDRNGVVYERASPPATDWSDGVRIVRLEPDGRRVTLPYWDPGWRTQTQHRAQLPNGSIRSVGMRGPRWIRAVLADGRVAVVWTDLAVVWVGDAAKPARWALLPFRDTLTTGQRQTGERMLRNFEAEMQREGGRFVTPRPSLQRYHAQIAGLAPTPDGGLWVIRTRNCASFPAWRHPVTGRPPRPNQVECQVADRLDANGRRLSGVFLAGTLVGVLGDRFWLAVDYPSVRDDAEDLEGFQLVVALRVPG
jgi:hypothetical protein